MLQHRFPLVHVLLICVFAAPAVAWAQAKQDALTVKLVPFHSAFHQTSISLGWKRLQESAFFKASQRVGLDLGSASGTFVIERRVGNSGYYLFYKSITCPPNCNHVVQRIRKTITNYPVQDDDAETPAEPEVIETFQVEAFKALDGQTKKPDQHYGMFSIREGTQRRVIEKEYELGVVRNEDDDGPQLKWPHEASKLYKLTFPYAPEREAYDEVKFEQSIKWTLRFELDANGSHSLQMPELHFSKTSKEPLLPRGAYLSRVFPSYFRLMAGKGFSKLTLGATESEVVEYFGPPTYMYSGSTAKTLVVAPGLHAIIRDKKLDQLVALNGFRGQTAKSLRIGDAKKKLLEKMDKPDKLIGNRYTYDGIAFVLSKQDRIASIYITEKSSDDEQDDKAENPADAEAKSEEEPAKT